MWRASLVAAMPTFWAWAAGRYQPREIFTATSPDRTLRVIGAIRADFPATDLLDPSATAEITLSDPRAGRPLDVALVRLRSYDDFNAHPRVSWQEGGRVQVVDIDIAEGHSASITLSPNAPPGR